MKKIKTITLLLAIIVMFMIPRVIWAVEASKDAQLKFLQKNETIMPVTKRVELFVKRLKALNFRINMITKKILEKAQKREESGIKNKKLTSLTTALVAQQNSLSISTSELEKLVLDLSKDSSIDKTDIKEISKKISSYKIELGKILKLNKDVISVLKLESKVKITPIN